ncbi:TPA: hypothetical protein JBA38_12305 [Legionella pneumophila]|uniref:hypothetical protein n=1 Tax=Legionella pneumophila TaxID=446 RepID=UPI001374EC6E|nr:hypothetical protein [Legionella pneumophila]HAT2149398.1 hypothetical protein [Legionella pneumophila]HAT2152195.1 hypothetical protein [Legionella pneumophila]HAT8730817.1 hypothetical protein [Legionella pneumophila]HAT8752464.1 hypothetical protein [Legionella pneumophila]HAU1643855.1 hypothetical protein [Legionella pneumophila]
MDNNIQLIILHRNNTPEIVESLIKEANALNINCICLDTEIKKDSIKLQNNFYLFYSVLNRTETESYISFLSEKCWLIHYTLGRNAILSESSMLKAYQIPYVSIKSNNNPQLLKKINEIGGFPVLFSSDQFSNSLGKYYVENENIFLQVIDTIRNKDEFDFILKYIEHDFHIRVYIVNYQYNSAVIYYKDKNDYSTNRLDRTKRHKMSFCQNISPHIKKIAINYARYLHVETAGIDILVSRNNEYFILEANNPMMYNAVPESLAIVSRGIIQGLLNKYEAGVSNESSLDSSIPLSLTNKFITNKKNHLDILFTCRQLNISIESEKEVLQGKKVIILNSKHCPKYFDFSNQIFGYNLFIAGPICQRKNKLLEKHNLYEWQQYNINIKSPDILKPSDLEKNCLFPVIFKVEINTGDVHYLKVDTAKQCLAIITMYQDIKYNCSIYPYIYMYVKRKALLVGGEVIAIIEYVQNDGNQNTLFNSGDTISLDFDKVSEQELSAFKTISDLFLFQGGWTLEYAIDIQSNFYIISYDNGYELDNFRSSTSDLLIPKIINKLFMAYKAQKLTSSLYKSILALENISQKFYLLYAYKRSMLIEPISNSLNDAEVSFNGITHKISNCLISPNVLTQNNQISTTHQLSLYDNLSDAIKESLIPTVVIDDKTTINKSTLQQKIQGLNYPLTVRPYQGSQFEIIYSNINSIEELIDKIHLLNKECHQILIQEMCEGLEYRVLIVDSKIVAVAKKQPAALIGNGQSSISMLIDNFNQFYANYKNVLLDDAENNFYINFDDKHNNFFHKPQIITDKPLIELLKKSGYKLESVLGDNEKLVLPFADFYGAVWIDQTDAFPKKLTENLIKISNYIGMKVNSIDILVTENNDFKIIKLGSTPFAILHHFITYGSPRPVVQKIFNSLFEV